MFNCVRPSSARSAAAAAADSVRPEDANVFQPLHQGCAVGPLLQYYGMSQDKSALVYSILGVYPRHMAAEPTLQATVDLENGAIPTTAQVVIMRGGRAELLDTVDDYSFWRFLVSVTPDTRITVKINYTMSSLPPSDFLVPGINSEWRYAFFSCNGYSLGISKERLNKYKPSSPLWNDILTEKRNCGLHLLIGGGDQLYFDDLWNRVPYLRHWAGITSNEERKNAPFMCEAATKSYYLDNYLVGFSAHGMREVLASVPCVMSWDDHDIFDGWGSYPDYLQDSLNFKGIFRCAYRMYMLFQQHISLDKIQNANVMDGNEINNVGGFVMGTQGAVSRVLQCGKHLACVLPDTRSERKLTQIMAETSWASLFAAVEGKLDRSTRHLLFLAPVPIIYPHASNAGVVKAVSRSAKAASNVLGSIESLLGRSDGKSLLHGCAAFKSAVNLFNEPELLDDLMDHWTAKPHESERYNVLKRLQRIADETRVRVSFLSGDVHLAAVGAAYTRKEQTEHVKTAKGLVNSYKLGFISAPGAESDHRLMFQFVSSGICNLPPPNLVTNSLLSSTCERGLGDSVTFERMLDIFQSSSLSSSMSSLSLSQSQSQSLSSLTTATATATATANSASEQNDNLATKFFLRKRNWGLGCVRADCMEVAICAEAQKGQLSGATTRYCVRVPDLQK